MISNMQHAVDTGVHELLLVVMQVLGHVLRHKHDVTLHVNHEEKAIQGLQRRKGKIFTRVPRTQMQFNITDMNFEILYFNRSNLIYLNQ